MDRCPAINYTLTSPNFAHRAKSNGPMVAKIPLPTHRSDKMLRTSIVRGSQNPGTQAFRRQHGDSLYRNLNTQGGIQLLLDRGGPGNRRYPLNHCSLKCVSRLQYPNAAKSYWSEYNLSHKQRAISKTAGYGLHR